MDITQYIPDNDQWIDNYCSRLGTEFIMDYYHRLWLMLYEMRSGDKFDIQNRVKPANMDLFIKMACLCIRELDSKDKGWYFSEDGSKIICV